VLFAAYFAYCRLLAYPANFMFQVEYLRNNGLYATVKSITQILSAVRWNIVWLSPTLTLLVAGTFARRTWRYVRLRDVEPVDLLVIFSTGCFVAYAIVGGMWGKYTTPGALAAVVAIGLELGPWWRSVRITRPVLLAGVLVVTAGIAALLPLPYARSTRFDARVSHLLDYAADPRAISLAAIFVLASIGAALASRAWMKAGAHAPLFSLALVLFVMAVNPAMTAHELASRADRGPFRVADDHGFASVVDFLNQSMPPGAVLVGPKDVGFYTHVRYYGLEMLAEQGTDALEKVVSRPEVRYVVDSTMYPIVIDRRAFADLDIARVEMVGDFRILIKR